MPAPALQWINAEGEDAGLGDLRGNPVILSFLGSEWDPARAEYRTRCDDVLRTITSEAVAGAAGDVVKIAFDDRGCNVGFRRPQRSANHDSARERSGRGRRRALRGRRTPRGLRDRRRRRDSLAVCRAAGRVSAPRSRARRPCASRWGLTAPQTITCAMTEAAEPTPTALPPHASAAAISSRPRLPPRSRLP